jgi:phosphatidylinositol glycan class V
LKQLPNFIIATPMVVICVGTIVTFLRKHPSECLWLGLRSKVESPAKKSDDKSVACEVCLPSSCFVYVAHLTFLLIFGLLYMHIQVITRFIASSSPVIYWYLAVVTSPKKQPVVSSTGQQNADVPDMKSGSVSTSGLNLSDSDILNWENTWPNRAIFVYFMVYLFVGVAAFSNFLPWT